MWQFYVFAYFLPCQKINVFEIINKNKEFSCLDWETVFVLGVPEIKSFSFHPVLMMLRFFLPAQSTRFEFEFS